LFKIVVLTFNIVDMSVTVLFILMTFNIVDMSVTVLFILIYLNIEYIVDHAHGQMERVTIKNNYYKNKNFKQPRNAYFSEHCTEASSDK
jgi:hypothetical protein